MVAFHTVDWCQVVNSHLVCDPTIRQLGFDPPRQQWSLLNRFCTEQGHCGACRRKWRLTDTDLCPCGETQTMSHIVESLGTNLIHRKKMCDFTVEFLKCAKFHGKFTEGV